MKNIRIPGHGRVSFSKPMHYVTVDLKSRYRLTCRCGEIFDSPIEQDTVQLWIEHKYEIATVRNRMR